jgi:hypothetical protein
MKIIPIKIAKVFFFGILELNKNSIGRMLAITSKIISKNLIGFVLNKHTEELFEFYKNGNGQIMDRILTI